MKLLLLGDTHGNTDWVQLTIETAKKHEIDWIFQVGDFGYWEHKRHGVDYLNSVQDMLFFYGLQMAFLEGNHDNQPVLWRNYGPGGDRHLEHPEHGFWRVRDNLWYAPRGHRWDWDGVKFLALGGAYSVDSKCHNHKYAAGPVHGCGWCRTPGRSWWPEELITEDDVDGAIAGGICDVVLSHDCPDGVEGAIPPNSTWDRKKDAYPESLENRRKLGRVVKSVRPYVLVHGHYHHRNTEAFTFPYGNGDGDLVWWETLVEGLTRDGEPGAFLVWETAEIPHRGPITGGTDV